MPKHSVVHLVTPYLFHTGSWVYSQIRGVKKFEQFVFTQRKENLDQFPLDNIYSVEDFSKIKRKASDIYKKYTKNYGLFFPKIIRQINPDLFHAHMGFEAVRWLNLARKKNIPLITTFYGQDVSKLGKIPYWREKYKELFKYGCLFLAEGPYLKQQLIDIGCPGEKVIVQKLGLKLENYVPKIYELKNKNSKFIILQVSTFREKKGIEYSLKAIAMLKKLNYNIEYKLIGAGYNSDAEKDLRKIVKQLNIEDVVNFLGKKAHKETIKEMKDSDIFLHPSVNAKDGDNEGGAPVGVIEASAVGLPVVATLHADIPEVIKNGETGFLVEERNSKALAEKIAELINNPDKIISFGKAGRKYIENEYDIDIWINKLETIYKEIVI